MPYGTAPPSPPIGWGKPSIKPGEIPPTAVAAYPPQYCREVHFAHFKDVYTGGKGTQGRDAERVGRHSWAIA